MRTGSKQCEGFNFDALISQLIKGVAELRQENKELRSELESTKQKADFYHSQMVKIQDLLGQALGETFSGGEVSAWDEAELPFSKKSFPRPTATTPVVEEIPSARQAEPKPDIAASGKSWELVVSQVHNFPKLVGLENWLRDVEDIEDFIIRSFQEGVATFELWLTLPQQWEAVADRLRMGSGLEIAAVDITARKIEGKLRN